MKFIASLLLMAILSFAACLYSPWWSIAIVCFLVSALIYQRPGIAFLTGFFALLLLWGGMTLWLNYNNGQVLAHRVAPIILKADNPALLILITALIGALVGGLAALSGSLIRPRKKL